MVMHSPAHSHESHRTSVQPHLVIIPHTTVQRISGYQHQTPGTNKYKVTDMAQASRARWHPRARCRVMTEVVCRVVRSVMCRVCVYVPVCAPGLSRRAVRSRGHYFLRPRGLRHDWSIDLPVL